MPRDIKYNCRSELSVHCTPLSLAKVAANRPNGARYISRLHDTDSIQTSQSYLRLRAGGQFRVFETIVGSGVSGDRSYTMDEPRDFLRGGVAGAARSHKALARLAQSLHDSHGVEVPVRSEDSQLR